ncbi:Asparagine--tRNA ligase [Grifola frondosa]|uniref:asparagine--tRNA ligase n=1 Tax=Grifola frondosa TaxID=5627 RepID=A0A1C7LTB8_GRIFR|nr:Asparagine--tRNA ligase [Grifola frondosa]
MAQRRNTAQQPRLAQSLECNCCLPSNSQQAAVNIGPKARIHLVHTHFCAAVVGHDSASILDHFPLAPYYPSAIGKSCANASDIYCDSERMGQAVFTNTELTKRLTNGASVRLSGRLTDSIGAGQDKELQVESVEILGECDPETYPMQKHALSVEYLRDHCHLRTRTREIAAMMRLRDSVSTAMQSYFQSQGFCYVHTPILTSNDCEGAGETFKIAPSSPPSILTSEAKPAEYFGHPAYLTVSSQLHLEALATAISRVYTLSPCFRAERSQTNRHLAEFWMLEAEWAFTSGLDDICQVVEDLLKHSLNKNLDTMGILWQGGDQSKWLALQNIAQSDPRWTRISYDQAVKELTRYQAVTKEFVFEPAWGKSLQSEHERWIAEKLVNGPVFVTDYPAELKPFYMRLNDDGKTVACFDLLIPHLGELVGGSLREERHGLLEGALERHNLGKED